MSVYSILTRVDIQTEPRLLLAGSSADFEAHPLPSPYGIHYDWHFGDGSALLQGRRVAHTYADSGFYNVCVSVNNTISSTEACAEMFVYEKIEKLEAESSSPTELHSHTTVWARLASGNNITWTFSMGDGMIYYPSEPNVTHSYSKDGNYTVNVTATNALGSVSTNLTVQVFVFQVISMEPSGCIQEQTPVSFQAWVSGNESAHFYEWSFGDGSSNETHLGDPRVSHKYEAVGNYQLSLLLSSGVNRATKVSFSSWVCVQPALANISLSLEKSHYAVGEQIQFQVRAEPEFDYSYEWDFGKEEDPLLAHGSGDIVTMYENPGQYLVTVTVFNNISTSNTSLVIEVLRPVGPLVIQHNGTKYNNLTLKAPYAFTTSSMATNVTYTWNFGDGNVHTGQITHHTYNISGNYNVTLTAANAVSSNQTTLPVAVLAQIHGLTVNASLINVPLNATVHFEAQMEEGDSVRFSWILCDRCTSIPGTHTMFYTFRSVGTFSIIVTAENDVGTDQASIFLYVQRELEGLQIFAEDMEKGGGTGGEGCCFATNRIVHLHAGLKEGTNMTFTWNLFREQEPINSSSNLSGKTVEVNSPTPGPCEIFLRAANLLGQLSVNRTIYFLEPARGVNLQISNNPVAVNTPTNLTVLATEGSDLQYNWSVNGDFLPWTEPSNTHTFITPGKKQVTVNVSNEVSSKVVSEVVIVQEVISGLRFTATEVTVSHKRNYIATGVVVLLQGEVLTGTDVMWTWLLDGRPDNRSNPSVIFREPKTAIVTLNATNDVSGQVVSREFFVQDRIQGLELKASAKIAGVQEKVEFTISMAAGSDVHLNLSISENVTVTFQTNGTNDHVFTYAHNFTRVDNYMVNLTAQNQVK